MTILARRLVLGILRTWRALTARRPPKVQNGTFGIKIVLENDHFGAKVRFGIFAYLESSDGQEAAKGPKWHFLSNYPNPIGSGRLHVRRSKLRALGSASSPARSKFHLIP